MAEPLPDHAGHRSRLRERLLAAGSATLADYEVLEYLLMLAIPRRDTKPMAKALLKEFGSIGAVLAADPPALMRVPSVGESAAAAIALVREAAQRLLKSEIDDRPMLASWQALLDYLRLTMAHATIERVRVLYLNTRNALIRDEIASEGSIDEAAVHVREVIRRAIDLGAASIILVHNHPSGDPQPSRADIQLTREIIDAGRRLKIAVHDHVIIGQQGHTSMRALGLI